MSDDNLESLLNKANKHTKDFIKKLEEEEKLERVETTEAIINDIKAQKKQTEINKKRFINDIKSGLGEAIKEKPNVVEIKKKPWYYKFKEFFNKF